MAELPPLVRDQRKADSDHLKLLAIFHFVGAGLALLGIFFVFFHYVMFHAFFSNPELWKNQAHPPPPPELVGMFKWFYLFIATWFLSSLALNLLSGLFIRRRKYRTFSLVVSGINCIHIPLGTVLGVFTMIVLLRDSVRELYEAQQNISTNSTT